MRLVAPVLKERVSLLSLNQLDGSFGHATCTDRLRLDTFGIFQNLVAGESLLELQLASPTL